ncbi:GDSL lipase/esterase protein [Dioscorea alata]|uniref:GDSL lipase/esterase protein n=1 Tax=Dioscorea alata TaxID=55571 RepID=A0ACB7WU15_DIOAL|nr:GDSL lipase/esterase protein [Dioscorea alata]
MMLFSYWRKLVVVIVVFSTVILVSDSTASDHHHHHQENGNGTVPSSFTAVIIFGDSIMDTGNNNFLPTISKCNFPPYGKDFPGHRPTGRFSNGKVPSDLIASRLGIKEFVPAYLSPELESKDLITGVCFASGASGYDPLTSQLNSVLSMDHQLELFQDYKFKLQENVGKIRANTIIEKSLYVISSGSNDVANTYFTGLFRRTHYSFSDYAVFLVQSASSFIQDLHQLGARSIAILSLPPLGCLPSQRTLAGGLLRDCVGLYNQAAQEYNTLLIKEIQSLSNKFSGSKIIYVDIYNKLLDIIQRPKHYGLEVSTNGCCGTGTLELGILCKLSGKTCIDDTKYVFWDTFHPTQRTYEILVDLVVKEDIALLY